MGQCDTDLERQEDAPKNDHQHWRNMVQHSAMEDEHLKGKETWEMQTQMSKVIQTNKICEWRL